MYRETRRAIRWLLQSDGTTVREPRPCGTTVLECRRCGTTADTDGDPCTNCGHDGIARYDVG